VDEDEDGLDQIGCAAGQQRILRRNFQSFSWAFARSPWRRWRACAVLTSFWLSVRSGLPDRPPWIHGELQVLENQDQPAEEKIAFLKSLPAMQSVPAVRNNRFNLLDYNEAISGPRIVDGAEGFAEYMRTCTR
jgi:hypothetical protein